MATSKQQPAGDAPALDVDVELVERLARPGPRYTSYPTAPHWSSSVGPEVHAEQLRGVCERDPGRRVSVYIHLPFCRRLCHYCGCNVVITARPERVDRYLDYLAREMDLVVGLVGRRPALGDLHLGGGTPTFLDAGQIDRLWALLSERFEVDPGATMALEVDPRVTTRPQLELLRKLGFCRLSMGVQDFDPEVQRLIGRDQAAEVTEQLYRDARDLGFRGINFDLVYGLPGQTEQSFSATVERVVALRPDRLALFSYAHLPALRPNQGKIDEAQLPAPSVKLRLFLLARRRLLEAGYVAIGMDHFAVVDDELASARREKRLHRNFQGYTVNAAPVTLAFGTSAISDIDGFYAQNHHKLRDYYAAIDASRLPTARGWVPTHDDRARRTLIERLMCNFTVDCAAIAGGFDLSSDYFDEALSALSWAEEERLVVRGGASGRQLEVTPLGQLFVRNLAMAFDAYLDRGNKTFSSTV